MRFQKVFKAEKRTGLYKNSAGFTIIEILISLAILVVVGAGGFFAGFSQYESYSLRTDKETVVSMLQKARSRAMNNINQVKHGFSIQSADFVLFEGDSYATRNASADQTIPRSGLVSSSGVSEVVFAQLSGDVSSGTGDIILSISNGNQTITINDEGRISW